MKNPDSRIFLKLISDGIHRAQNIGFAYLMISVSNSVVHCGTAMSFTDTIPGRMGEINANEIGNVHNQIQSV